jgi:hypothetical protein
MGNTKTTLAIVAALTVAEVVVIGVIGVGTFELTTTKLSGFEASAISPSFSSQILNDSRNDWIDWTKKYPFERDGSIDITRADYFSNGKTLNATIWLACKPEQSSYIDPLCDKNNLQISVEDLRSKNTSLNEYTNITINKLHESFGNQIQSSEDAILAGNPAHKIVYTTYYGEQQNFKVFQIWTVKDGKAYIITYNATPSNHAYYYKSIIQNMINSFDIGTLQGSTNTTNKNYSSYQNDKYGIKISYPRNWQPQQQQQNRDNNNFVYDNRDTTNIFKLFPRTFNSVTYGIFMDEYNNN